MQILFEKIQVKGFETVLWMEPSVKMTNEIPRSNGPAARLVALTLFTSAAIVVGV